FFIAGACMVRVRIPSHPIGSANSLLRQMGEGWAYFRRQRWIWSITGAWALMNAVQMGAWQVLGPIIAKHTFGSAGWGLTLSVKSIGLLIASVLMLRFQFSRPLRDGMVAAAAVGIPMVVLGQSLDLPYLIAAAMVAGIGSTVSTIAWDTSLQQGVPKEKLSRVLAFDEFGSYVVIPLGEILAVPVADRFGLHTVETWAGLIFIVAALVPLSLALVRQMTITEIRALAQDQKDPIAE
ncbi:MAG: MFS transporter, partial [Firmicutes bacterium]|nr:MFS transporter [Bacillota bacterium]